MKKLTRTLLRQNLLKLAGMTLLLAICVPTTQSMAAPGQSDQNGENDANQAALRQVVKDEEKQDFTTPTTIKHGHIDLGPRYINGNWRLLIRDDSKVPPVWRDLSKVVFQLPAAAKQTVPADPQYAFTGLKNGGDAWVIPQNEKTGVPWVGWSTQSPAVVKKIDGQVKYIFEGHQGPGKLTVFTQDGNFTAPKVLWDSAKPTPQVLNLDLNTHAHVNWVFTQPGVHLIKLKVEAVEKGGKTVSDTQILRFAVGNTTPEQAQAAQWSGTATSSDSSNTSSADSSAVTANSAISADSNSQNSNTLIYISIGLLIVAIIGATVAVVILQRSKKMAQSLEAKIQNQTEDPVKQATGQ